MVEFHIHWRLTLRRRPRVGYSGRPGKEPRQSKTIPRSTNGHQKTKKPPQNKTALNLCLSPSLLKRKWAPGETLPRSHAQVDLSGFSPSATSNCQAEKARLYSWPSITYFPMIDGSCSMAFLEGVYLPPPLGISWLLPSGCDVRDSRPIRRLSHRVT